MLRTRHATSTASDVNRDKTRDKTKQNRDEMRERFFWSWNQAAESTKC